ncbi:MAG: TonB-dependent receptor [Flammeovirgaceae bacterium]
MLKIKILKSLIFFLLTFRPFAQTLILTEEQSLTPIQGVMVYGKSSGQSSISDERGKVDLGVFSNTDTLYFQHLNYFSKKIFIGDLAKTSYEVQLKEKNLLLEEIVLSASKWEQKRQEVPQQIVSIRTKDIELLNPQTSADMLANTGQVFNQKSQQGGGSPMIRGFAANAVLIVVDGVRMNNAIFRGGNLQNVILVDANALKGAEIVLGAGSVMYGSDALGGVMHFRTKSPEFSEKENGKVNFFGDVLLRYSSANQEQTKHLDFNIGLKKWGFYTSITHSDFDDLRTGSKRTDAFPDWGKRLWYVERINGKDEIIQNPKPNIQKFSGYSQWNIMQKISFQPNEKLLFQYAFHYTTSSDIPRYDNLLQTRNNLPRFAEWYYGAQKWTLHHFSVEHLKKNVFYEHARLTAAYQNIEESRHDRRFNQTKLTSQVEQIQLFTLNADAEKLWANSLKSQLFYGVELAHNFVNSNASARDILTNIRSDAASRYPNKSKMTTIALYAMAQHTLHPKIRLTTGIRYNFYYLYAPFTDKQFFDFPFDKTSLSGSALNGNLGTNISLNKNFNINALISTGFRAPNVDDTGKIFDGSANGVIVVPNPKLKPEKTYNTELTISKVFAQKLQISWTGYYTRLIDAMVTKSYRFNGQDSIEFNGQKSAVQAVQNTGEAYIWGIQTQLKVEISPSFWLQSTYHYSKGKDLSDNSSFRHVPPAYGMSRLTFKRLRYILSLEARYSAGFDLDELAPSEKVKTHIYREDGSPSWYIFNLQSSTKINKHLDLNLALENILDQHYRPYSSGISAAGRNLVISLRGKF